MRVRFVDGTIFGGLLLHRLNHVIKSGIELFGVFGTNKERSGVKRCLGGQRGAMGLLRVPSDIAFVEVMVDGYSIHF